MLSSTAQSLRLRVRFVHTSWTRHPTTHYASMLPPALASTMQYKYLSRYHHSSPHLNNGWYEIWQMLNSQLPISLDPLLSVSASGICASHIHITFPWSPDRVTYVADFTASWSIYFVRNKHGPGFDGLRASWCTEYSIQMTLSDDTFCASVKRFIQPFFSRRCTCIQLYR